MTISPLQIVKIVLFFLYIYLAQVISSCGISWAQLLPSSSFFKGVNKEILIFFILIPGFRTQYLTIQESKVLFSSIVSSRVCLVLCGPFCKERETESDGKPLLLNDL